MNRFILRISIIIIMVIGFQIFPSPAFSQNDSIRPAFKNYWYLQPNVGLSQYFGDLNKDDFWNQDPRFAFGAALGYQLNPVFGLRGQFLKANLYSERSDQNKLMTSNLWDGALNLTVNINEIFAEYNDKRLLNIYLFTGPGFASYKTKIEDITTGATLNEHAENQNCFVLPFGGGASIRVSNSVSVNLEYGDRTVFGGEKLDFTDAGEENNDHYSYASAGVQFKFGVKDMDGDGIRDKDDLCPEVPGKVELAGCPDKDNDGIADKDDACPDIAGKPEFKGCPDTDSDGIIDSEDDCPTVTGKKELKGCPDKDGDGIADKDDKCPDVPGKKELAGCPDRDGDGIADNDDACPDVKGLAQFKGCPDTDGDGIADNVDKCPDVFGVASNGGCPEALKGAVYEKIVYFDSDASVALAKNIIDLNEIAAYMNENPDAIVSVAGHADWRESDEYNLRLSEKRADYVIKYLKKKGMKTEKVEKSFFGKSKPIADNNTREGRALNRRVEIRITK